MKIYLCGQKAFGAAVLKLILEKGHEVVGVSAPLAGSSGGLDRLRAAAEIARVPVMPAGMLNADNLPGGIDLIVAAHSHDFIGAKTRLKARFGAIGYHPSLLPRHRGRDAIRWTLKMGDAITGGTVYWLGETMDGGPVAAHDWLHVPAGVDADELWRDYLFPMGLRLVAKALADISAGRLVQIPQDESVATWEPSWERQPVRRPDLILLGDGRTPAAGTVIADSDAAWEILGCRL